jgi:hypothetical protein
MAALYRRHSEPGVTPSCVCAAVCCSTGGGGMRPLDAADGAPGLTGRLRSLQLVAKAMGGLEGAQEGAFGRW